VKREGNNGDISVNTAVDRASLQSTDLMNMGDTYGNGCAMKCTSYVLGAAVAAVTLLLLLLLLLVVVVVVVVVVVI